VLSRMMPAGETCSGGRVWAVAVRQERRIANPPQAASLPHSRDQLDSWLKVGVKSGLEGGSLLGHPDGACPHQLSIVCWPRM